MAIKIMVNGLPGNLASEFVRAASSRDDIEIIPFSLTGPEIDEQSFELCSIKFELVKPDKRDESIASIKADH